VTTIATAKRFQDLLDLESHQEPYAFDKIFSAEAWGAKSLSKKKLKLLKKVDPAVKQLLHEGEVVYYVTWGLRASFFDSFFLGWLMYMINRMAIVLTTKRILLIQITRGNVPRELRSQIRYSAVDRISGTPLGHTKIKFHDGSSTVFAQMPRRDRKYIRDAINRLAERAKEVATSHDLAIVAPENLCPHCFAPVEGFPTGCARCGKRFKTPNKATVLSLIFPGFGDFYLGHRAFAMLEILGAALIWLVYLVPNPELPRTGLGLFIGAVAIWVVLHGIDAVVTRRVATKGIYPAGN
jgi:hypothetical protein